MNLNWKWISRAAIVGTALLVSCATSPTGRKQIELLPESEVDQMGAQSFQQVKGQSKIDNDPNHNAYVKCIVDPLIKTAGNQLDAKTWEIVVFDDPQVNAFALPGGKIGVYNGIFKAAKNDAQMATVLGHEIGHVIAHHGNERVSQGLLEQGALETADLLSGSASPQKKQIMMAGLGLGAQYGVVLPFSRTQESEADVIGLDLMSRAGFDPNQAIELWHNMMTATGSGPPEWMSDHPADENRIKNLQSHLPDALSKYNQAKASGNNPHCTLK